MIDSGGGGVGGAPNSNDGDEIEAILPSTINSNEKRRCSKFVGHKFERCKQEVTFDVGCSIISYASVSLGIVYFNYWVFTSGFKHPVFVSWMQQIVGVLLFFVISRITGPTNFMRTLFPLMKIQTRILIRIVPLSITFVLMVALSNVCLQKTLLSTYQVARSLSIFFVVILSYLMLGQRQSPAVLGCCCVLVLGFIVGSLDPSTISLTGLLAGGFSSFFQSLYNVLIKRSLAYVDGDNQILLCYNLLLSAVLFFPVTLIAEGAEPFVAAFGAVESGHLVTIWASLIFGGILGTALNMTTYWVVKATSPLTFNIVGFAKSMVQSLGGIVIMGDHVTPLSFMGITLSILGTGAYTFVKARENSSVRERQIKEVTLSESNEIELKEKVTDDSSKKIDFSSSEQTRLASN